MPKLTVIFTCIFFSLYSCTPQKQSITVSYNDYKINKENKQDSSLTAMLQPYANNIHTAMSKVIGFSTKGLTVKQPESDIGNFMADCMKIMAEKKFERKIDAAFVNFGGIRSYLPKGDITIGAIYEIMPFDNLIVLQEVKGNVLKEFLNKTAELNGWPVSNGVKLKINNKQAFDIFINEKPLDENATYTIANSDYIARGGDGCAMLTTIPVINKGYLFRDALIDFIQELTKQGKPIDWHTEGRVTY